jgi:mRNA-degrading endonuclease HigB of HigAB toxin-antitoxin module
LRVLGREKLQTLRQSGAEVEKWMRAWMTEVLNAHWKCPGDVTTQFPNVVQEGRIFVFPVLSSAWSIDMLIAFPSETALVMAIGSRGTNGR